MATSKNITMKQYNRTDYDTLNPATKASQTSYDNSTTGSTATTVQGVVDELFISVSNGKSAIASAITNKGVSTSSSASFQTMANNINAIHTDPTLQSKTVTPSTSQQTVVPDSGYDGLSSVKVNAMTSGSLNTPSVNSSGLVTASVGTSGYLAANTSKTTQLTTQSGKTVTPSTSQQTAVASGRYTTGNVYVAGDVNLVSSNIKSGVSIFGVNGSYGGGYKVYTKRVRGSGSTVLGVLTGLSEDIDDAKVLCVSGFQESYSSYENYPYMITFNKNIMSDREIEIVTYDRNSDYFWRDVGFFACGSYSFTLSNNRRTFPSDIYYNFIIVVQD